MLWTFRFRHLDAKVIVTVNVVLDRFKFPFQGVHKFTEEKLKSLGDELAKAKATKRKRTDSTTNYHCCSCTAAPASAGDSNASGSGVASVFRMAKKVTQRDVDKAELSFIIKQRQSYAVANSPELRELFYLCFKKTA